MMRSQYENTNDGAFTIEEAAILYAKDIDKAESKIRIYAGECHAGLYAHSAVVEAFQKAAKKKPAVIIYMNAGPILSALIRDWKAVSGVLDLSSEGIIQLYRRDRRGDGSHYRIIDDKFAIIEKSHDSLENLALRNSSRIGRGPKLKKLIRDFDNSLKQSNVKRSKNPKKDFFVLSPDEIDILREKCMNRYPGRPFWDLTVVEIGEVLSDLQEIWSSLKKGEKYWIKDYNKFIASFNKTFPVT